MVLSLFCRLFVVFVVGLWFLPAYGTCVVSCAFRLPPAVSGSGVRCGRACWARVSAVPCPFWLGCRGVLFALFFVCWLCGVGCWVSLSRALWSVPLSPFFRAGLLAFFFVVCVCMFRCPFPRWGNCGAVAWMAACRHLTRDTTGLRQYRPTDRTALASAVAAVTTGPVAAWPAQLLPHVPCRDTRPRRPAATHEPTAPLTAEQLYVVAVALLADGGESFVHHHGPAQIAGCIQGPQRDAPDPWHATLRGRTRVWGAGDGAPPPGPKQGEALVLQTAGYQAIIHGHAGGYRSHVLAGGRWTVWHSTARQGAFPPLPHVDWGQGPTQAYYMSADPWPLAVLLHTVSAPNKRQEPGWVNPPTLVWSPDQEDHLRAAWQGDAIRATDVPDLHAGPITHARPAATLAVAQRGQQNPQWVVCMFSPADAHIVVCNPERLPGPEAVIRVADCTRMIIKALREGEHHALLLQIRL